MPIHINELTVQELEELRKNLIEEVQAPPQKPKKIKKTKKVGRDLGQKIFKKKQSGGSRPIVHTGAKDIVDDGDRKNVKCGGTTNMAGKFYRN